MGCSGSLATTAQDPTGVDADIENTPLSTVVKKNRPDAYYIDQADKYFNSLESKFDGNYPNYSRLVARYEYPPYLLLTAFGRIKIHESDTIIRLAKSCICIDRKHKVFDQNPFVRSKVTFYYGEHRTNPIYIYEEFTFSSEGEMTFIEAWNAKDDLIGTKDNESWPDPDQVQRLSTKIPGLGNKEGLIDVNSAPFIRAAKKDKRVADFRERALHFGEELAEVMANRAEHNTKVI